MKAQTRPIVYLVLGLALLALLGYGVWKLRPAKPPPVSSATFKPILEEVAAVDVFIGYLTPDSANQTLAYINGTTAGRRLVLLDLNALERHEIATSNEVAHIFGWSPDGRYLAIDQIPFQPEKQHKTTPTFFEIWLTWYAPQTGTLQRLTADTNVMESSYFWLGKESYLMGQRQLTHDYGEFFLGEGIHPELKKASIFVPDLAIVNGNKGAYGYKSELYLMELKPLAKTNSVWDLSTREVRQISDFRTNAFNGIQWIRYSPARSNFLFCARPANSDWRYLYQFDPAEKKLTQLSHEDTYNGQWLLDGTGYAYIINTNNSFQIAIRTGNPQLDTNLFAEGNAVVYKASISGDKVYASAALGVEPHGIWEYDITNHHLRKLAGGTGEFAATRIVQPAEFQLDSFDGLKVPCFLFPPVAVALPTNSPKHSFFDRFRPRTKYPLVIYVPPITAQFQRQFDAQSQLFANCGFYYAAINYRGCDGYGEAYSKLDDPKAGSRDVLALYQKLLSENPDIDQNNVFLATSSEGMNVVSELLTTAPSLWRAAGLDKCALPIDELRPDHFQPEKLPPMVAIMGTQDPEFDAMKKFVSWAATNHVTLTSVVHTNATHITYNVNDRRDTLFQLLDFFLAHKR